MIIDLLGKHFIAIFLIIGFSMKLWTQRGTTDHSLRYYWVTVVATLILIAADSAEVWSRSDPAYRFWRILSSVVGYTMRPVAALSIVLIIYPRNCRPWFLWIPCVLNALVYCTSFFHLSVAFTYDPDYSFFRGPLGYTVFAVSFFYILFAVFLAWRRYHEKDRRNERFVLYLCAVSCIAAALLDMKAEGACLNTAIMVSSVFLYVFLRAIDTSRDSLTQLLNRTMFYDDCNRFASSVSGVASIDMNGLKLLNDIAGHEAGDTALKEIGKILTEVSSRSILAYRIGGDEFALLFLRQPENAVHQAVEMIKGLVRAKGYSVSAGYAMRGGKSADLQDLMRWADEDMYADKARFYSEKGHDRRKHASGT